MEIANCSRINADKIAPTSEEEKTIKQFYRATIPCNNKLDMDNIINMYGCI